MKLKVREEILKLKKAIHGGEIWSHFPRGLFSKGLIDFSSNVNPLGPSEKAIKAVKKNLWKLRYYPDTNSKELKKTLAQYVGIREENTVWGNGSTELIKNFCEAFVNKGGKILIPQPTYSDYEVYARLYGAEITHIHAKKDFTLDYEKIFKGIAKEGTIFLCNPNNPTGRAIEKLEEIIQKAREHNSLVFLDEAYTEFANLESFCSRVEEFENLFVLRSLTKFWALPGLRIGYGVGNKEIIECLEKLRPPWNVNVLAQIAAIESIKDKKYIQQSKRFMKQEKNFFYKELLKIKGLKVIPSDANFFLIDARKAGIKAPTLKQKLIKKGMLIRDCGSFRGLGEYFIRVCVRNREENIRLFEELKNIFGE